ncbi:hypothetical protein NPIL_159691 [Nephila pilipes]|uniref:Uncharacterized protein n=1 Tax=Nephila pilipes TaxID=299642 RepID=A0A8X6MG56_NEPPI|nr:hypothetical protein NPIL_159691 [Nephila pilipes]
MDLSTTKDFDLIINIMCPPVLTCYTDSDWASDTSTRSSTRGTVFLIEKNPFYWLFSFQNTELYRILFLPIRAHCCSSSRTINLVADTSLERSQT